MQSAKTIFIERSPGLAEQRADALFVGADPLR
jgi:hypothetical protein